MAANIGPVNAREAGPRLADLTDDLLWPLMLRAPGLALRAGRIGLVFFATLIVALLLSLGVSIDGLVGAGRNWAAVMGQVSPASESLLWSAYISTPLTLVREFPITTLVFVPVSLLIWIAALGAVARMVACELAQGVHVPWPEALGFAGKRLLSMLGAVLGPVVFVWFIGLGLAVGGLLLLRWPGLNVAGGLLYGLSLMGGFVAVFVLVVYLLGHNLLIPAVVCEGTDSFDAVQRAYAYVCGKPLRLILYTVFGVVQWALVAVIAMAIATGVVTFTAKGASAWGGKGGEAIWAATHQTLAGAAALMSGQGGMGSRGTAFMGMGEQPTAVATPDFRAGLEGTYRAEAWLVGLWAGVPVGLAFAYTVCLSMAISTTIYLIVRRINDGQDVAEIWMPGMIEGTMAESLAARAQAGAPFMPPEGAPPPRGMGEAMENE